MSHNTEFSRSRLYAARRSFGSNSPVSNDPSMLCPALTFRVSDTKIDSKIGPNASATMTAAPAKHARGTTAPWMFSEPVERNVVQANKPKAAASKPTTKTTRPTSHAGALRTADPLPNRAWAFTPAPRATAQPTHVPTPAVSTNQSNGVIVGIPGPPKEALNPPVYRAT